MIPLESATAILPRMPTGRAITAEFPLTIIKPPVLDTKCRSNSPAVSSPIYRLLRSRRQRRNSSASSVHSGCNNKIECKEFVAERVEVFQLKDTGQHEHVESVLLQGLKQSTCTLPDNIGNYQKELVTSRQNSLISSAKERHIFIQEEPLEMTPELNGLDEDTKQQCSSTDSTIENKQTDSTPVTETTKQNENLPVNKRNRKKSSKIKKTPKKRKILVKKVTGVSGVFARLVGSHRPKQQGQQVNLNGQVKSQTNLHQTRDTSPDKNLSIQKLHAAYAPKKNENKNNTAVLLPQVSNTSLTKDQTRSCTSSPRKQEQELESISISTHLPSPQKLLNSEDDKVKKIYLSETHSGKITGIPCAPPSTPSIDELKKVEYIPSLSDVKSQRAVKSRLVNLANKMRAEEQRKKEKSVKEEQKRAYGAILQLKQRQRAEIYALNKVMTELENENFRKFMEENSAETLPV